MERKSRHLKTIWLLGFSVLLLMLIAVGVLLYTTVRLQQGLINRSPEYSGKELYSKALQQVDNGDYAQAEGYLEEALLKDEDSTYRNQLAVVKYRLKKYPEAIAQYKKLIDQKIDVAFAYNGIGNAYRDWAIQDSAKQSTYLQEAELAYQDALKADSLYVAAYSNWALLLANQGDGAKALLVLDEGILKTNRDELKKLKATLVVQ